MSVVKPIPGKNANPNQQTGCHQDVPNPQNETSNSFKSFREEFTLNEFLKQKQLYLFLYLFLYLYTYSFFLESIEPQLFVMFRSIQKTLAKAETIITKHKGRLLIMGSHLNLSRLCFRKEAPFGARWSNNLLPDPGNRIELGFTR